MLSVHCCAHRNLREYMEDNYAWVVDPVKKHGLFLLCDGHGGNEIAKRAVEELPKLFMDVMTILPVGIWPAAWRQVVMDWDQSMKKIKWGGRSGATMAVLLWSCALGRAWTLHLGDSRIVCWSPSLSYALQKQTTVASTLTATKDHSTDDSVEVKGVYERGGFVSSNANDTSRVNGELAMTRALGDFLLKPAVSNDPDIAELPEWISAGWSAVIASDGLWDVTTSEEVCTSSPSAGALLQKARARGSTDNISVMSISWTPK